MLPITELVKCLQGTMTSANIRIFSELITSFFCVRYQVTTRSLARYNRYSLRQIFRFLKQSHDWLLIRLLLFKTFIHESESHYIAAIDETVEGKSGKSSHGIGRFYSSCAQTSIKSVCFFGLSLIEINTGTSYMLNVKQVVYTEADQERIAQKKQKIKEGKIRAKNGKRLPAGRKPGTKNQTKSEKENQSVSYRTFSEMWKQTTNLLLKHLPFINVTHLVADSAYGTADYMKTAMRYNCFLISKMAMSAALYIVSENMGKSGQYNNKADLYNLDKKHLKTIKTGEDKVRHETYQFEARNKSIKGTNLNIVVRISTNKEGKQCLNIWFTNDLTLDYQTILDYYSLRFQIEYEFRDAKQHFGLSDFKNYKKENLTNFVNLSFTITLVSKILLRSYRKKSGISNASVLDLKIIFNARYMARKIIKLLPLTHHINFYDSIIEEYVPEEVVNAA